MLDRQRFGTITTELALGRGAGPFYYAEDYHQQYLHKNPGGYCNHGPNGLTCPVGLVKQDQLPSQESVLRVNDSERQLSACAGAAVRGSGATTVAAARQRRGSWLSCHEMRSRSSRRVA